MRVSKSIKPLNLRCDIGDLVQFEDKVCMVVRTDSTESWGEGYGLVCLTEYEAGNLIVKGVSTDSLSGMITCILVKSDEVYVSRKEEE